MVGKLTRLMIIGLAVLFLSSGFVSAQNFTDDEKKITKENSSADVLTDEQIQMILESEGIPLTIPVMTDESNAEEIKNSQYTLGTNDVITISVLRHPEVSGQYMINAEGKIQYEFVGDVEITGLTKNEVKDVITEHLTKYIISPDVNVKIVGFNSKVIYVIGEVGRPGKVVMRGDTMTVREALVQAGLPLLTAKAGAARLITPSDGGKPKLVKVDVNKLLYKGDLRQNLVMSPGDTLYIPPTVLTSAMRAISPISAPVGQASGLGRTATTGFAY